MTAPARRVAKARRASYSCMVNTTVVLVIRDGVARHQAEKAQRAGEAGRPAFTCLMIGAGACRCPFVQSQCWTQTCVFPHREA